MTREPGPDNALPRLSKSNYNITSELHNCVYKNIAGFYFIWIVLNSTNKYNSHGRYGLLYLKHVRSKENLYLKQANYNLFKQIYHDALINRIILKY